MILGCFHEIQPLSSKTKNHQDEQLLMQQAIKLSSFLHSFKRKHKNTVTRGSDTCSSSRRQEQTSQSRSSLKPSWTTTMILNWEQRKATSQISPKKNAHISSRRDLSNVCIHSQVKDLSNFNTSELMSTFISQSTACYICVCFYLNYNHKPHTFEEGEQTFPRTLIHFYLHTHSVWMRKRETLTARADSSHRVKLSPTLYVEEMRVVSPFICADLSIHLSFLRL